MSGTDAVGPTASAPAAAPMVRVVVLNWNSVWFTARCVEALLSTDHPADRLEIVVADNASVDGSLERLRHRFPGVRFLPNHSNLGFAEGCNRAMRDRDDVDLIALVNNDAVPEPGWLEPLVAALDADPAAGAAAAQLVLDPPFARVELPDARTGEEISSVTLDGVEVIDRTRFDGVDSVGRPEWPMALVHRIGERRPSDTPVVAWVPAGAGRRVVVVTLVDPGGRSRRVELRTGSTRTELRNGLGTERNDVGESYDRGFGVPYDAVGAASSVERVTGFCGGGVLLRTEMLDQVGLFDPAFFAYYEDVDLSWRAARAGWRIVAVPAAVIRHSFGGSGGARSTAFFFLNHRNWLLTSLRNGDASQRRRALAAAWERTSLSFRVNVASPIRHRRRPSMRLVAAWSRVWLGVAAALLTRRRVGRAPVGSTPVDAVRSRLQPAAGPRAPEPRAGGPKVVVVDVTGDPDPRDVLVGLDADPSVDVVAAVRAATGGLRRLSPAEWGALLGQSGPYIDVSAEDLALGALDPRVLVAHSRDATASGEPSLDRIRRLVAHADSQ